MTDRDDFPSTSQSPEKDISTEELAEQERQAAARAEQEAERDRERRAGGGQSHQRSQGDRP
jgi:hypothetical protein